MAIDTVLHGGSRFHVLFDLVSVVVVVIVEVADMTLGTGAAGAAIDPGVAIAIGAVYLGAIGNGVTCEAIVLVNTRDNVTTVAVQAEGR